MLGAYLRWVLAGVLPLDWDFAHLRHAHSHLGYFGLLFPLAWLGWRRAGVALPGPRVLLVYSLANALAFFGFVRAGYGPEAIIGSTLVAVIWLRTSWQLRDRWCDMDDPLAAVLPGVIAAEACVPFIAYFLDRDGRLAHGLVTMFLTLLLLAVIVPSALSAMGRRGQLDRAFLERAARCSGAGTMAGLVTAYRPCSLCPASGLGDLGSNFCSNFGNRIGKKKCQGPSDAKLGRAPSQTRYSSDSCPPADHMVPSRAGDAGHGGRLATQYAAGGYRCDPFSGAVSGLGQSDAPLVAKGSAGLGLVGLSRIRCLAGRTAGRICVLGRHMGIQGFGAGGNSRLALVGGGSAWADPLPREFVIGKTDDCLAISNDPVPYSESLSPDSV